MGRSVPERGLVRTRSGPGALQEWARSVSGVGQERTRSGPGAHQDIAKYVHDSKLECKKECETTFSALKADRKKLGRIIHILEDAGVSPC